VILERQMSDMQPELQMACVESVLGRCVLAYSLDLLRLGANI
jgi:hypothetical protein